MNGIIYKPAAALRKTPLPVGITTIGIGDTNIPRLIDRPAGHEQWFFLQLESPGVINGRKAAASSLIFWEPGTGHSYGNHRCGWTNSWGLFYGTEIRSLLSPVDLPFNAVFSVRQPRVFRKYLNLFIDEYRMHITPDGQILRNLFENMLHELERGRRGLSAASGIPEAMLDLKFYLDTCYREPLSLAKLGRRYHMSPSYLTAKFRSCFGKPVTEYLIDLRMSHAGDLLESGDIPIKAVAIECGYTDASYFSKAFFRRYGVRPSRYRAFRGTVPPADATIPPEQK